MIDIVYRYDPAQPPERQPPASAEEARRRLEDGNDGFASLVDGPAGTRRVVNFYLADIGVAAPGSVPRQEPFAVVLGCSDARVPVELIFDQACNNLFVVRVAGNVLGQEQLGSIDYAARYLGQHLKLLVVLGHSHCGAVTAAADAYLKPADYLGLSSRHHIRAIVNTLFPAVRGAAAVLALHWGDAVTQRPGYRAALIEVAVMLNAALKATILQEEFADEAHDRRVVFGVYDLATRRVNVPLRGTAAPASCLLPCPADRKEFQQLAVEMASSPLIASLLG